MGFPEWAGTESERSCCKPDLQRLGPQSGLTTDYVNLGSAPDQAQFALDLGHAEPIRHLVGVQQRGDPDRRARARRRHRLVRRQLRRGPPVQRDPHDRDHGPRTPEQRPDYQGVSASCRGGAVRLPLPARRAVGELACRSCRRTGSPSVSPSTPLNTAYRFMVAQPRRPLDPSVDAALRRRATASWCPTRPEVFTAMGAFGRLVVVDPTTESVWVRLGPTDLRRHRTGISQDEGAVGRVRDGLHDRQHVAEPGVLVLDLVVLDELAGAGQELVVLVGLDPLEVELHRRSRRRASARAAREGPQAPVVGEGAVQRRAVAGLPGDVAERVVVDRVELLLLPRTSGRRRATRVRR